MVSFDFQSNHKITKNGWFEDQEKEEKKKNSLLQQAKDYTGTYCVDFIDF